MKANSIQEAWNKVNEIFPTDYEKDYASSERAGYDIYRHPTLNYYSRICDLGNRLEVLTGEYGETVTNVWIENQTEQEDIKESVDAMHAVKELGVNIFPLFEMETYTKITLVVDGSKWNTNETERKVYNGLKRGENQLASDLVASYCDNHGIRWGTIGGLHISYYEHGNKGENGGHFIITAYIGKRVD